MPELSSKVANWLHNVLVHQYIHRDIAYQHIYEFLLVHLKSTSSPFKIKTDIYTSVDGQSTLLVKLFGFVTVNRKRIKISIWIPSSYPFGTNGSIASPIAYVTPDASKAERLQPGNHVDSQGKVYHPYLTAWNMECNPSNLKAYNLLEFINVLHDMFTRESPISVDAVPQRPSQVEISDRQNVISRQTTGPELPPKPQQYQRPPRENHASVPSNLVDRLRMSQIPLKYQSPLPLPNVSSEPRRLTSVQSIGKHDQVFEPSRSVSPSDNSAKEAQIKPSIESLMDSVVAVGPGSPDKEVLTKLSDSVNSYLDLNNFDSVNSLLASIRDNRHRVDALYDQLSHHKRQATANCSNLEDHAEHLKQQVTRITSLNHDLVDLDVLNSKTQETILTLVSNPSIRLEDLIVADLALVNQLYDILSELSANRDVINLLSGNFQSQGEFINDASFEDCTKLIRSLGRDSFWLELMKLEITEIMGLKY